MNDLSQNIREYFALVEINNTLAQENSMLYKSWSNASKQFSSSS